jgi:hypothetical protein
LLVPTIDFFSPKPCGVHCSQSRELMPQTCMSTLIVPRY